MKYLAYILLFVILFSSCETEITDFKTQNLSNSLVVYGEITNFKGPYSVRINYTNAYAPYDIGEFEGKPVKQAKVNIIDDLGNIYPLTEVRNGYYETQKSFQGAINKQYQLKIKTTDGLEIESSLQKLVAPPVLNEFKTQFVDAEKVEDMRFDVIASIKDKKETEDFYFIKRQDFIQFLTTCKDPPPPPAPVPPCFSKCWRAPLNTQPILKNDFLINGSNIPLELKPLNLYDIPDWVVQLDIYSIPKNIFTFWKQQEDQRTIGGGLFDKIPAQIVGNLRCTNKPEQQVLGAFVVAGLVKQRVTVRRFHEIPAEAGIKVQAYADFKNTRFKYLKIDDCSQAGFIDYNIGFNLPEF